MRSILKNHVDDFLKILQFDKARWKDFWERLKKRYSPLLDGYEECAGNVEEKLGKIRRMDLDRFRRVWEESKPDLKKKAGYELRIRADELELSRSDFTVFLFSGVGDKECCVISGKFEKVIMIDVFAVWMKGKLSNLHEVVLECVRNFRKRRDKSGS
jgi:hypothetical protein